MNKPENKTITTLKRMLRAKDYEDLYAVMGRKVRKDSKLFEQIEDAALNGTNPDDPYLYLQDKEDNFGDVSTLLQNKKTGEIYLHEFNTIYRFNQEKFNILEG